MFKQIDRNVSRIYLNNGILFLQCIDFHKGIYSILNYKDDKTTTIIPETNDSVTLISIDDRFIYIDGRRENFYSKIDISNLNKITNITKWPMPNGYNSKYCLYNIDNKLSLLNRKTEDVKWSQEFTSKRVFLDENILLCRPKKPQDVDNSLLRIDIKTGSILWEFNPPEKQIYSFGATRNTILGFFKDFIITEDDDFNSYLIHKETGDLIKVIQFKNKVSFSNNKLISIFRSEQTLNLHTFDLETFIFNESDLLPEIKKLRSQKIKNLNLYYIVDDFCFLTDEHRWENGGYQEYDVYVIDIKSNEIVWNHSFEKNMGKRNFSDIKYDNDSLYFLRGDGILHIFKREK